MNDDFTDLENELKQLSPRPVSEGLRQRVAVQLETAAFCESQAIVHRFPVEQYRKPRNSLRVMFWSASSAAIAAVWVFLALSGTESLRQPVTTLPLQVAASDIAQTHFKPVSVKQQVLETQDLGFVTLSDGSTAKKVYEKAVDTYTWRDAKTNASLSWSIPREELRTEAVTNL
jgi:hypothetical protein